ncbi:zinc-finger domain-containing protein [uncultured Cohaesibacter sp.]|uniref:zinc-finger domain-containing protein n=1 Tax=uncultured Cohaesibacter sp. TaxID=1002546 RepID=UPI00292EC677|nr:zinc-finger domain-containing protein [uncultured Cohaesibacter sp.]
MADPKPLLFKNDEGVSEISIGQRSFECMGATPPQDHPHIFLNMGQKDQIRCPYCSTLYRFDPELKDTQTRPARCCHQE